MKGKPPHFVVTTRTLKILAALVWYLGGIILILKGSSLLSEAATLKPQYGWQIGVVILGIIFGSLKAKFIFRKSCQKNLDRIDNLTQPKIWQFFRLRFFVALILMILLGITLSTFADNNYPMLIGVALLDISIAIALLGSSFVFWKKR